MSESGEPNFEAPEFEIPASDEPEIDTNVTSAETTWGETTPGSQLSSTPAADAQVAENPAPTNSGIDKLLNLANAGDSEAQYEIAVRYLVGRGIEQSYVEAAKWLQESAAGGVISAQYNLGVLYDSGRGVEADAVEALIWFHSAAEKEHGAGPSNSGPAEES
jgi:TPR repeat protein